MMYVIVAAVSFFIGLYLPSIWLRIRSGGAPSYIDVPKCVNGKIVFRVNPMPAAGCEAVKVFSYINGMNEMMHSPPGDTHSRPHPGLVAVDFSAKVEYRLSPDNFVSLGTYSVPPCTSSSSSSSSLSSSSSSSSTF